tara:strand:+ start:535 stop:654 length:120 start_codon:yes stop_codon:yes gene_type:complete
MDIKLIIAMGCLFLGAGIVGLSFTGMDLATVFKFEMLKP